MSVNLLDISDEILLHIFQFVDATDLYQLSFICQRFHDLVRDEFLWAWCEGRSKPNSHQKIDFFKSNVNDRTRVMLLAGDYHCETLISDDFFERIGKLKSLTVLALENQYLHGAAMGLSDFPSHLVELSLRNSYVTYYRIFFRHCSELKNLRVLCLDQCHWIEWFLLSRLTQLESLEILSLYLCKQPSDYEMRCFWRATNDFKALKILDVRFTGYGDEVLKTFCCSKSIREIYFQGYSKTFQLDCAMRKLEILQGSPAAFHNYLDPFLQVDNTDPVAVYKMFGGESLDLISYDIQKVTDKGVAYYATLNIDLTEEYVPPKSILYKPPYGKCTCGYMGSEPEPTESFRIPSDSQRQELETKIALLLNRKEVPDIFFLPADRKWIQERYPQTDMEIFIMRHMIPEVFNSILSRHTNLPVSNVIEVDIRGNVVRHLPRRTLQDSLVTRVILSHHNAPAPERSNVETGEAPSQPTPANRDEPLTSRNQEDEPCCSKSLTLVKKNPEVQEDNLCVKEKIKSLKRRGMDMSSSEDKEPTNSVAFGDEEEACNNAEPAGGLFWPVRSLSSMMDCRSSWPNHIRYGETGIRCLSLRGYDRVTDISLCYLEDLRLDLLDVTLTSVTSGGVERFRSTNPQCRIIHETACKCRPRMHF